MKELEYQPNGHLTLGVELELQLVDKETQNLCSKAVDFLAETMPLSDKIKPELFNNIIEINFGICQHVQDIEEDLRSTVMKMLPFCEKYNLSFSSTGSHPTICYADEEKALFPAERYSYLKERYQWIAQRIMVAGVHIHVGIDNPDDCIRFHNFFMRFIPHFIALSASSPFWQGKDTGLASWRSTLFESNPAFGQPYHFTDWQSFETLCSTLIHCNAITYMKDLWWDIRPCPHFGTIEIRICDGIATLDELSAIVSFVHILARWFDAHKTVALSDDIPPLTDWQYRENKWRAIRHGLDAELIIDEKGNTRSLREDMTVWLKRTSSYQHNYQHYIQQLHHILQHGGSYQRQRTVFQQTQSLEEVIRANCQEFVASIIGDTSLSQAG